MIFYDFFTPTFILPDTAERLDLNASTGLVAGRRGGGEKRYFRMETS
jgi:hypothetical protein